MNAEEHEESPSESSDQQPGDRPIIHTSEELLQGQKEVWIEHNGELYRLRLTSRGKLYLTK